MTNDSYDPAYGLVATVSELSGRRLRASDIVSALGLSNSAYYSQREEGRLLSADNLLKLAAALDINPVELLVRYGLITRRALSTYALSHGWRPPPAEADDEPAGPRKYPLRSRYDAPPI